MTQHFVRCPHCGLPHSADTVMCPVHRVPVNARSQSVVPPGPGRASSMRPPPTPPLPASTPSVRPPPLPAVQAGSSSSTPPRWSLGSARRPSRARRCIRTSSARRSPRPSARLRSRAPPRLARPRRRRPRTARPSGGLRARWASPSATAKRAHALPRPTSDAPLVGQLLDNRYRIFGVIAKGGMGVVYDGIHKGSRAPSRSRPSTRAT